jgi:hypothetical protein
MIREKFANTSAAELEAVLQHRHQANHGKNVCDAGGNLEAKEHTKEAALNSDSTAEHAAEATFDGRSSRDVCVHAAAHWPQPKGLATGRHCEYSQGWDTCNRGFFRAYFPAEAIARFHKRAANGILGCNQVFALSAGVDGNVNYSNYWCACVECRKHPLLISPLCLRRPSVGQRKTARFVFVARRRVSCEQAHFGEDGSSFCAAPQDATVNDHVRAVS